MRAPRAVAREREHAGAEGRQDELITGHGGGRRGELVEVAEHDGDRVLEVSSGLPLDEVSKAHAQAEQEATRIAVRERRAGGGDLCRRVRPDAQDARGDDDLAGGREALVRDREELRPGPTRHPDRAVAERLELGDGLTRLLAISTAKLAIPDADPAESDLHASLQSAAQILPVTRGVQLDERASGHDRAMVLDVARGSIA